MDYSKYLNNKTILITGGTGSFGHQMIHELSSYRPKSIIIYSRDEDKQHKMKESFSEMSISKKIKFVIGDVRDYDRIFTVCKNVDIIFQAAALKQVPSVELHPMEAVKTNILGAYNVAKAAVARNVKHVIAISTDKAVKPVNAMGMTKAVQEKLILSDELSNNNTIFSCVRYGNVLGSRGSIIPLWDSKIQQNKPLPITHPDMTRFMLTLSQAIDLVFYSLKYAKGGEIFVKKAPGAKIVELARAYAELKTGKKNYPVKYIGIRAGEKLHEILVSQEEMRHVTEQKSHFVIQKESTLDTKSLSKPITFPEFSSSTVTHLTTTDLKKLMLTLNWII